MLDTNYFKELYLPTTCRDPVTKQRLRLTVILRLDIIASFNKIDNDPEFPGYDEYFAPRKYEDKSKNKKYNNP